ncbi:TonB-dependent receptor [Microbulbifer celer]|uniref:TonB-dependent receptor n=1 Tax=Microbulbifer celer TaxID=435905 RepID=A0ABW3U6R1_9GAMM|nr:TonB-dependent receptor [Microbulbifer celer]UFN56052.1 TonB-dependent receptor [Microbulbifer celer]
MKVTYAPAWLSFIPPATLGLRLPLLAVLLPLFLFPPATSALAEAGDTHGAALSKHRFTTETISFALPAQPLYQALTAYAQQAGLQLFFRREQLLNIEAVEIDGAFSRRQALTRLLENSNLDFQIGDGGEGMTLVIFPSTDDKQPTPQPLTVAEAPNHLPIEETYVTGVRSTLRQSLAVKRNSNHIVDVTTSADIGQFPDRNVADALQRIPGVSVDRIWGEGRDVNIRGTDKDINRTLLNGQQVASAYWWANDNLSRGFNYSTLASQLVESLEVHKTPRADLDEGSIGGTVIVRTRKPLDLPAAELRVSLEQQYNDLAETLAPQISTLGSWKNHERTFGILASINWQNRDSRRDGLETFADNNFYSVTDQHGQQTKDVYAVWGGGSALFQQQRTHTTGNLTLQWAPDEHWNTVLNLVDSQVDIENSNHNFLFSPGGYKLSEAPPATVTDPIFIPTDNGKKILAGGTLNNADSPGAFLDSIQRQAYIDTQVYDLDLHYRGGRWENHAQFGFTRARGGTDHDRLYRFSGDTRVHFRLDRDALETDYLDLDPQDPAALDNFSPVSRDWIRAMENREYYGQLDFHRTLESDWIQRLAFGLKLRDLQVENHLTTGTIDTESDAWKTLKNLGLDAVNGPLSPTLSTANANASTLTRYILTDPQHLQSVIHPLYAEGAMSYAYDPSAYFAIGEQSLAGYVSADFERGPWHGDIGLRVVQTRQVARAYQPDISDDPQSLPMNRVENHYRDALPNLNLRYQLNDQLMARAAVAKVMARPNFKDLTPNIIIEPTSGYGTAGNPQLDPYRADQLDLGLEWYFGNASLLSATAFFKDISTFVYPHVDLEQINGQALYITRPRNGPGADIRGLELQWQHDFAKGFGTLTNYTYTNARVPAADDSRTLNLPGNSRSQLNASIYYESEKLNGRLGYNYRSRSYGEIIAGSQSETAPYRQWDASVRWQLTPALSMTMDAANLTGEVIKIRSASGIPQGFYQHGRRLTMGLKWQL